MSAVAVGGGRRDPNILIMATVHVNADPSTELPGNTPHDEHNDPPQVPPPLEAWDAQRVGAWLEAHGGGDAATVASNAMALNVDGATLGHLDAEGWRELGVASAVQRARLLALVEAEAHAIAAPPNAADGPPPSPGAYKTMCSRGDAVTFKHGGAAEHMKAWHAGVAHANAEGYKTKQHFLGFLGMYNVLSLLTFTIAFNVLLERDKEPITSWIDAVIFLLILLSALLSFCGINATAIVFNITSACSDANSTALQKMPHMTTYQKHANARVQILQSPCASLSCDMLSCLMLSKPTTTGHVPVWELPAAVIRVSPRHQARLPAICGRRERPRRRLSL